MRVIVGDLFKMDWDNRRAVIDLAIKLGKGQTVFKKPGSTNYNITHTSRTDRYRPEWIEYQT